MQGLVVGMAFYGIGDKLPVQQLSFFFMLLQMGAIANMAIMPELIETRLQLKLEQSDALYSSGASIVTQSAVNNALAVAGNFITSVLMFSFSRISWSNFGILYGWALLSFMTVTNYLRVIAAVAPSPSESVQAAMPGLLLFILFNNFFVNRATAPAFVKWLIYVSPMAWAIEQIVTGIYGENAELVALYGYDGSDARTVTAVGVLLCEMAFFQTLEIFLLRRTNAIVR
jgi:ABC-type multidrug transport system permease subunit